ncbi:MAG: cytochrome P450 [Actinomycetota bacterium]
MLPLAMLALKGDLIGLYEQIGSHGDLSYVQFLHHHVYMVKDPEDIFSVLVTDNRKMMKGQATHEAKRLLGEGLLTSNGDLHSRQRKLLQPTFHPDHLRRQGAIAVRHATELSERWEDGQTVDVGNDMMHVTLRILGDAILDYDLSSHVHTFADALDAAVDMVEQILRPWGPMLEKLPIPVMRRFRATRERLYTVCDEIIEKKRANLNGSDDLISLMLHKQAELGPEVLPDLQIRDELVTIILTGHETLTQQLTWTFYLLGRHPEFVATLQEEIDAGIGDDVPTTAHLERLPYTEKVLLEAMRVFPPVYALQRRNLVDYEVGGYPVPEGSILVCSQYLMHKSDRWFEDPARFDPSRWTDEFKESLPGMCYFPFGRGPRACIGEAFAMVEARLLLAVLLRSWTVTGLPGEVGTVSSISLRPDSPVRVVVGRRERPS